MYISLYVVLCRDFIRVIRNNGQILKQYFISSRDTTLDTVMRDTRENTRERQCNKI